LALLQPRVNSCDNIFWRRCPGTVLKVYIFPGVRKSSDLFLDGEQGIGIQLVVIIHLDSLVRRLHMRMTILQHLFEFHKLMDKLDIYHEDVLMKLFMFSLGGDTRLWYKSLSPSSISSLKEFHTAFHQHCKRIYSAKLLFEDCCNKEFIEQEKISEQEDFLQEDQANFHEEEEKMSESFQVDEDDRHGRGFVDEESKHNSTCDHIQDEDQAKLHKDEKEMSEGFQTDQDQICCSSEETKDIIARGNGEVPMESFERNESESFHDRAASFDFDSFEDTFEIISDVCVVLNEDQPIFDEYLDEEERISFLPCMETYKSFPPIFDEYNESVPEDDDQQEDFVQLETN
jgi:hypothetical protein